MVQASAAQPAQEVVVVQYSALVSSAEAQEGTSAEHSVLEQQIEQVCLGRFCHFWSEPLFNATLTQAYGPDGLGLLTVAGVPGFVELRQRLLPLAQAFAVSLLLWQPGIHRIFMEEYC